MSIADFTFYKMSTCRNDKKESKKFCHASSNRITKKKRCLRETKRSKTLEREQGRRLKTYEEWSDVQSEVSQEKDRQDNDNFNYELKRQIKNLKQNELDEWYERYNQNGVYFHERLIKNQQNFLILHGYEKGNYEFLVLTTTEETEKTETEF
jgi:hypothetical protein